nr:acyltransferase family protein [Flexivirga aerilata]
MPALDGIRGVLVIFLLTYHFGVSALHGAWLTLNVFFVLSGFLIVRLLVAERVTTGKLRFGAFYARRARRLFPALGALLLTVLVWGFLFASDAQRAPLRWDVLATMGYFMNWRLIAQSNQYFVQFTEPSLLQHTWSLSVEEQFYVVVPLLVLGLTAWLKNRRALVAVFLGLAVVSAVWMAYVGVGTDVARSHTYYGTDTRAQSLLLGAALGAWLAPRAAGDRAPLPRPGAQTVQYVGWAALAISVIGFVVADPQTELMTRGGMFALSIAMVAWVWAVADDRIGALQRVLAVPPLAALGRISYGCYLWHWPIGLWLAQAMPDQGAVVRVVLGFALTIGIAVLSYQRLELPVRREGLRAIAGKLLTARSVAVACVVALALGAVGVSVGAKASAAAPPPPDAPVRVVPLVSGQPAYSKPEKPYTVALYGDSVPYLLTQNFPKKQFAGVSARSVAVPGCDLLDQPYINPINDGSSPNPADCRDGKKKLEQRLRASDADVLVIFPSVLIGFRHTIDGARRWWGDPAFEAAIGAALDRVRSAGERAGMRVVIANQSCRDDSSIPAANELLTALREKDPKVLAELKSADRIDAYLASWAGRRNVPVADVRSAVCAGGRPRTLPGMPVYGDGIHFSEQITPSVWAWLLTSVLHIGKGGS